MSPQYNIPLVLESSKRGYRVNTMLVISFTSHLHAGVITAIQAALCRTGGEGQYKFRGDLESSIKLSRNCCRKIAHSAICAKERMSEIKE